MLANRSTTDVPAGTRVRGAGKTVSLPLLLALCILTACGGGGSSGSNDPPREDDPLSGGGTSSGEGAVDPSRATYSVSGELTANDALQVDADVNDPFTSGADNNDIVTAQVLPNPVVVKGFVTRDPTNSGTDRFADAPDRRDVFRMTAFASQSILLEIADFDPASPSSIDLDIGLFDTDGELLEASLSVENSFEAIVIPADGDYFLAVNAFSGASNYTLSVTTEFATAAFGSQVSLGDVRTDRLALTRPVEQADNLAFIADMRGDTGRMDAAAFVAGSVSLSLDEKRLTRSLARQREKGAAGDGGGRTAGSSHMGSLRAADAASEQGNATPDDPVPDGLSLLHLMKEMNSREGKDVFSALEYPTTLQGLESDPTPDRFLQWNLPAIGWTESRERLRDVEFAKRPIVAVIDSGMFVAHPDLASVLVDQRDFVPAEIDGDGFVADASDDVSVNDDPNDCHHFHGTHVSTIAVAPRNSVGITGVAPGTGLMGIKVGHNRGDRCGLFGDVANAILYAAGLPNISGSVPAVAADVINLSLGGPRPDPAISEAIRRAAAEGVIVVAAAGNDGAPVANYPAADDNVIAVAATDTLGQRSPYSSHYARVDIAAPGGDTSADRNGDGLADGILAGVAVVSGSGFRSAWTLYQGTSMASPTVAAGIALMKGIAPELTQGDIEAMLAAGDLTVDVGAPGFDIDTGFGLMSLPRMIESAVRFADGGGAGAETVTVVTSTPAALDFGASLDRVSLDLVRSGGRGAAVESITGSETLRLSDGSFPIRFAGPGSADGFGVYTFDLDRSSLEAGSLSGQVTFALSDRTTHVVPVSAVNQVVRSVADSAAVFFIIERLNGDGTFETLREQFFVADGVRGGAFDSLELEAGSYRFIYGTDVDNDGLICDQGELCGSFPVSDFGYSAAFVLNEDIADASYFLQDVSNVALSGFDGTRQPPVGARRIVKSAATDRTVP